MSTCKVGQHHPVRPYPQARRVAGVVLAALLLTLAAACGGRGGVPPNSLTALLRSIPAPADTSGLAFAHADLAGARTQLGVGTDEQLPSPVRSAISATATPEFASAMGFSMSEITSWLEVSPSSEAASTTLVGRFETDSVIAHLRSLGWQSREIGLFKVFTPIGESARPAPGLHALTETVGSIGVAEKRIVYSPTPSGVEAIAAYRGGDGSLLALPGVKRVGTTAGSAVYTFTRAPSSGCPKALWAQLALRYGATPASSAYVLGYPDTDSAAKATERMREQLPLTLPPPPAIAVIDTRGTESVTVFDATPAESEVLLAEARAGGRLTNLPACGT